jgi:lysophospholipase L1-like esterase
MVFCLVNLFAMYLSFESSWSYQQDMYLPVRFRSFGRPPLDTWICTPQSGRRRKTLFRSTHLISSLDDYAASSAQYSTLLSSLGLALQTTFSSLDNLHKIQRLGENLLAGVLLVAVLQGSVALGQYRTNPSGQLIVPPGRTKGVAFPKTEDGSRARASLTQAARGSISSPCIEARTSVLPMDTPVATAPPTTAATPSTTRSYETSRYARTINHINRWLVLLVPWVGRQFSFLLARNTHLFHLAFIFVFSRFFDFPHYWLFRLRRVNSGRYVASRIATKFSGGSRDDAANVDRRPVHVEGGKRWPTISRPIHNLMVLGDSLAVGLGSVDVFDATRNNTLDYELIQNIEETYLDMNETGPIFPRVLAETLAEKQNFAVAWRSAGVDGGDAQHIHDFCLDVLREEVRHGRPPQLVVLLCGINDLKLYISKPWLGGNPGPRVFRDRLETLSDAIHSFAPDATIVLPAIPTQMFHKNSPLNIFPLNFVMDSLIGFWDSVKMGVADRVLNGEDVFASPTSGSKSGKKGRVIYSRIEPNKILSWYNQPNPLQDLPMPLSHVHPQEEGLIASDGVHPNAKCYALWAQTLADQLLP